TRWRTSGTTCAPTSFPPASGTATTRFWPPAPTPGNGLSTIQDASVQSAPGRGRRSMSRAVGIIPTATELDSPPPRFSKPRKYDSFPLKRRFAALEDRVSAAVVITRMDHTPRELRASAAKSDDAAKARRLLAIAMILEGTSRLDAARQAGMDRQTLRDWVHRYNEAGLDGLASRKPPGAAPKLTKAQMAELRELVIAGPDPETHKVIRWRCVDLRAEVSR